MSDREHNEISRVFCGIIFLTVLRVGLVPPPSGKHNDGSVVVLDAMLSYFNLFNKQ